MNKIYYCFVTALALSKLLCNAVNQNVNEFSPFFFLAERSGYETDFQVIFWDFI